VVQIPGYEIALIPCKPSVRLFIPFTAKAPSNKQAIITTIFLSNESYILLKISGRVGNLIKGGMKKYLHNKENRRIYEEQSIR
jgi:hypothetical protein